MNEEKDFKPTQEPKKPQNKGFYIAIALSLVMVATACIFAAKDKGTKTIDKTPVTTTVTTVYKAVNKPQPAIPKSTTVVKKTTTKPVTTKKVTTSTTKTVTVVETEPVVAQVNLSAESKFRPVTGDVLNAFSNGELVKSPTTGAWQTHNGVDFLAETDEEVLAISNGTVSEINKDALWGVVVTIDHGDGVIAKYCGLNENVECEVGAEVKGGSPIGVMGTTSDIESLEPSHLHLEITQNDRYLDPLTFII
ncbi:MAG: M23 family metallopeptidase [Oscillospiraceae bacterium]|nr:M23 family metallopeptidase [Oscillospiraceae bacterium]